MQKHLWLAVCGLTLGITGPASAQMTLPGKFEVTDTGSASYTIPIQVVPGTAGLEPKLSLQYDSRSGNGLLGVGWSLSGLPSITRCGRTIAQDGQAGGVSYDAHDRFCLDGQRLIAISGTYGVDGTEYRTERESFSKIVSYGTAGSGPAWFKVWTKAGLIMEFGNTVDSRIEAQGKASVRVWAINKTQDTKGNYFTVSYLEDNANGEYRPDRIDYTGNTTAGTAPANSVRLVYETRPDIVPLYQGGSLIKTTKRFTKVQAWQGENLVREYRASFVVPGVDNTSRISAIELCAVDVCAPATALNYSTPAQGWNTSVWTENLAGITPARKWVGDFNGDGLTDIAHHVDGSGGTQMRMHLSTGSGWDVQTWAESMADSEVGAIWTGDFNGDGRTDIAHHVPGSGGTQVRMHLSTGTSWSIETWSATPTQIDWTRVWVGDFNGDGLADIAQHVNGSGGAQVRMLLSSGTSWNVQTWTYSMADSELGAIWTGDFNGDGRTDIAHHVPGSGYAQVRMHLSTGTGWNFQTWTATSVPIDWSRVWVGDFNGDGLSDIAQHVEGSGGTQMRMLLSTGSGWNVQTWAESIADSEASLMWAGDFNGDGKTDIAHHVASSGNALLRLHISNGTSWNIQTWPTNTSSVNWLYLWVGDFNGDGLTDIAHHLDGSGGTQMRMHLSKGPSPRRATSISVVGGQLTQIDYGNLTKASPSYAKDTAATACVYPCIDIAGPLYVVSEVKSSNGLGGEYRSTYRYVGAKSDLHGRGFLGFRQMVVKDEQTGVEQITSYRQDYPFTGLVASREKKLGTMLLNRSINTYSSTDLGGTRRYQFLTLSIEESWELNGSALPSVTTGYQYDTYGNATQVSVSTGDGHSKATTNAYQNDEITWHLGRLTRSEVTSTTPSQ